MSRGLPVLLGATAFLIAACGSLALSARDLRADASAICRQAATRVAHVSKPASANAALPFLRSGVAVLGPELSDLRQLAPPTALSSRYHATLAEFSTAVQRIRATITLLAHGADPVGAFNALEHQLAPTIAAENGGWRALQIPACVGD